MSHIDRDQQGNISIHSLLAEGDDNDLAVVDKTIRISIHSLLAEGDWAAIQAGNRVSISIHSLLAEGDVIRAGDAPDGQNFNPLPPRGGRRYAVKSIAFQFLFQSTPSSRRETPKRPKRLPSNRISIHSLLAEGDSKTRQSFSSSIGEILQTHFFFFVPRILFSSFFHQKGGFFRCEPPWLFMFAPCSHPRVTPSAHRPADKQGARRHAPPWSDNYSQGCKSAGCLDSDRSERSAPLSAGAAALRPANIRTLSSARVAHVRRTSSQRCADGAFRPRRRYSRHR